MPVAVRAACNAAAAALVALLSVGAARAASMNVVDLPEPSGRIERVLFLAVSQPRATVVLLSGGQGKLAIDAAGTIRPDGNFLVRTREMWDRGGF
jgi:hypothetical protein